MKTLLDIDYTKPEDVLLQEVMYVLDMEKAVEDSVGIKPKTEEAAKIAHENKKYQVEKLLKDFK